MQPPRGVAAAALCLLLLAFGASAEDDIVFVAAHPEGGHRLLRYQGGQPALESLGPCSAKANPAWSSDGGRLAFEVSTDDGGTGIAWMAFPDEGLPERHVIASQFRTHRNPSWSAQGRLLAYEATNGAPYESVIAVYDTETGEETVWAAGRAGFFEPVWLPTPRILFAIDPESGADLPGLDMEVLQEESGLASGEALTGITRALFCIGLAGEPGSLSTELFLVTKSLVLPVLHIVPDLPDSSRFNEWNPAPAPSGSRFVYESNDGGDREIYHLDQRGIANLTNHRAADWNPVWSPDSKLLAFESFASGRRGVYRLLVETSLRTPIAVAEDRDFWAPSWAPDNKRIVCVTERDGGTGLAVFDAREGTENTPDTLLQTQGWAPAWRPKR
ncbi:MAG: hypothetical protein GC168_18210 [Candidatus Hydrogenedens sp.]|nr:hypothetical protein [Candidatus Hydrogenedens sp.]